MSPEAQRIAIAEACGWRVTTGDFFKYLCRPGESSGICCGRHLSAAEIFVRSFQLGECGPDYVIPNYLSDLNAMHEAEKVLEDPAENGRLMATYCVWKLSAVCDAYRKSITSSAGATTEYWMIHSTAAQRAEAFLKTLDLWDDSK